MWGEGKEGKKCSRPTYWSLSLRLHFEYRRIVRIQSSSSILHAQEEKRIEHKPKLRINLRLTDLVSPLMTKEREKAPHRPLGTTWRCDQYRKVLIRGCPEKGIYTSFQSNTTFTSRIASLWLSSFRWRTVFSRGLVEPHQSLIAGKENQEVQRSALNWLFVYISPKGFSSESLA